jgi:hypothetical protein
MFNQQPGKHRQGYGALLLGACQVAEWLHVSENTLANWRVAKTGPSYVLVGRKPLYRESDVLEWLETRRRNTQDAARETKREVALPLPGRRDPVLGKHRFGRHRTQADRRAESEREGATGVASHETPKTSLT